uniref:Uncharacterized protein n=1 Tax=Solanum lycopersicum TaxID=4081 RepID=A0A3Q7E6Y4_SOLLC
MVVPESIARVRDRGYCLRELASTVVRRRRVQRTRSEGESKIKFFHFYSCSPFKL